MVDVFRRKALVWDTFQGHYRHYGDAVESAWAVETSIARSNLNFLKYIPLSEIYPHQSIVEVSAYLSQVSAYLSQVSRMLSVAYRPEYIISTSTCVGISSPPVSVLRAEAEAVQYKKPRPNTSICIQIMNKDTRKDPFIQFNMSDGIIHWTVVNLQSSRTTINVGFQ